MSVGSLIELRSPAERYRPHTPSGRRFAVLELYRSGLRARDIADALRVELGEVLEALRDVAP